MSQGQPGTRPDPTTDARPPDPSCPLCRAAMKEQYPPVRVEETGDAFGVEKCPQCGLGRTRPQPADMAPYYHAGYYGNRHGATGGMCARRRVRLLRRWDGPGAGRSLLDFGCGDGGFLLAARRDGWDGCGVERERPASAPDDLPVVADLEALGDRPPFDAATFWHVLEHLDDPVGVLTRLRASLKPRGLVLAAVPNFGSWQSRLTGASWLHLDLPRHLYHFTRESLTKTFEASGFRVEGVAFGELEYDVIGWSQSVLNRGLGGRNEFFKVMSGRSRGGWTLRDAFQVPAGLGLSALATAPAWGESLIGRGGTLIVAARPNGG